MIFKVKISGDGFYATGEYNETTNIITVYKGAKMKENAQPKFLTTNDSTVSKRREKRNELLNNPAIVKDYIFQVDYKLGTPSFSYGVLAGKRGTAGRENWILENGRPLKSIEKGDTMDTKTEKDNTLQHNKFPLNQILFGPPGTGKTYNVIDKSLQIINNEKYYDLIGEQTKREEAVREFNKLVDEKRIVFTTFHQAYGYEEFIEGLRSDNNGGFAPENGIFKQLCLRALDYENTADSEEVINLDGIDFYKMSLGDSNNRADDHIFDYCIKNNCIAIGYGKNIDYSSCRNVTDVNELFYSIPENKGESNFNVSAINIFKNNIKINDIVIISYGVLKARAIGVVKGEYEYQKDSEIPYNHFRRVEWLFIGDLPYEKVLKDIRFSQQSIYQINTKNMNMSEVYNILNKQKEEKLDSNNYVIIIDEINRGNIAKIFGELITLIEDDKRIGNINETRVVLPYTGDIFGIPNNVYIIGTMNTADRSIALIDTALRRRFEFIECMPDLSLIPKDVDGVRLRKVVETINNRIEFLYDREHTIGHAYFMNVINFSDVVEVFLNKVIPLLQEYFYSDWDKIELILSCQNDSSDCLIKKETFNSPFFKDYDFFEKNYKYIINNNPTVDAFNNIIKE